MNRNIFRIILIYLFVILITACNTPTTSTNPKITELESSLESSPDSKFNHGLLGQEYLKEFLDKKDINALDKSIHHLVLFVEEYPDNEQGNTLLYQAYVYDYLIRGKEDTFNKLDNIYAKYPSINNSGLSPPSNVKAFYKISNYKDESELPEIKNLLQKAIKENPNHPGAHINFGRVFLFENNYDMAIASFTQAGKMATSPDDVLPYLTRAWYLKATDKLCEYDNPYTEKAIAVYKRAIAKFPDNAEMHSDLAFLYEMDGNINLSLFEAKKASELDPSVSNNTFLADMYQSTGQIDKAREIYMDLLDKEPADVSQQLAKFYFKLGEWNSVIDYTDRLIKQKSDYAYVYILNSLANMKLGNREKALKTLNQVTVDIQKKPWEYNLLDYLKGNISSEILLGKVKNKCEETEGRYYSGFIEILDGNKEKGRQEYENVISLKLYPYSEYSYAIQHLKGI